MEIFWLSTSIILFALYLDLAHYRVLSRGYLRMRDNDSNWIYAGWIALNLIILYGVCKIIHIVDGGVW